jgi:hypothetical protein
MIDTILCDFEYSLLNVKGSCVPTGKALIYFINQQRTLEPLLYFNKALANAASHVHVSLNVNTELGHSDKL